MPDTKPSEALSLPLPPLESNPQAALHRIQRAYATYADHLRVAQEHEAKGDEAAAKDAYFEAAFWVQHLVFDYGELLALQKESAAELASVDEVVNGLPEHQKPDAAWSAIFAGLDGRMKAWYDNEEERTAWQARQKVKKDQEFEANHYVLKRTLEVPAAVAVLEALQGTPWLELAYFRTYDVSMELRQRLADLVNAAARDLQEKMTNEVQEGLRIEGFVSQDTHASVEVYDDAVLRALERGGIDLAQKEKLTAKLDFPGKSAAEIVQYGIDGIHGCDPLIKGWLDEPYHLLSFAKQDDSFTLHISNPAYEHPWPPGLKLEAKDSAVQRVRELERIVHSVL
ncbi:hypothetical protein HYX14_01840 [Candidatus Woesearchaeota archaeon]|nr:hypothetical protein [Candidatus Woesearchaeota archaeon]